MKEPLNRIAENRLVAVIRQADINNIIPIVRALYEGNIKCIEITAETPQALSLIEKVAIEFDGDMTIGAGTVLDPMTARSAIMRGATFIVSPTTNIETIKITKRYGMVSIPGALTPTEILTAYEHGADVVKVFPANMLGTSYVKSINGPLPQIPIMVTGGVTLDNLADYLLNGAMAVGVGSQLVNASQLKKASDFDELSKKAKAYSYRIKEIL